MIVPDWVVDQVYIPKNMSKYFMKVQKLICRYEKIKACFLFDDDKSFDKYFEDMKARYPLVNPSDIYSDCLDGLEYALIEGLGNFPWKD